MIIQPSFPGGFVTFCDDIRHEVSNKVTIVGAYSGEMIVTSPNPVFIPQLCVDINYHDDIESFPKNVVIVVFQKGSDETELARFDIPLLRPDHEIVIDPPLEEGSMLFAQLRVEARISPFHVRETCRINVRAYCGDDEIRLGSLAVKLVTPAPPDE